MSIFQATSDLTIELDQATFRRTYIGVDLGKKHDHTVIVVLVKLDEKFQTLFIKQFKLGAEYASIIGYLKALSTRLDQGGKVVRVCVDQTGSEYFVEDLRKVVPVPIEGVMLSLPKKQEVLGNLRMMMQQHKIEWPYDPDLITEIHVERYQLTKSGQTQFSHPDGTHDDRLWALALAAYATRRGIKFDYEPQLGFGKVMKDRKV